MADKLIALVQSRRFWVSVGAVVAIAAQDTLGISEQEVNGVIAIVIGWVLGDSLKSTDRK
jgi:hypothetical protein